MKYDDLEKKSKAMGAILVTSTLAIVTKVIKNKQENNQREKLQAELNDVRYQLSTLKNDFFKSITHRDEIQRLEKEEQRILKKLKSL